MRWRHNVKLKDLIEANEDIFLTEDKIKEIGTEMYNRIKDLNFFKDFDRIEELPYADDEEMLDDILYDLYIYADYKKIWIE